MIYDRRDAVKKSLWHGSPASRYLVTDLIKKIARLALLHFARCKSEEKRCRGVVSCFRGDAGYWFVRFIQTLFHRDGWTRWLQVILYRVYVIIGSAVGETFFRGFVFGIVGNVNVSL